MNCFRLGICVLVLVTLLTTARSVVVRMPPRVSGAAVPPADRPAQTAPVAVTHGVPTGLGKLAYVQGGDI